MAQYEIQQFQDRWRVLKHEDGHTHQVQAYDDIMDAARRVKELTS